jgi:GNAT superfamily N-acetyltransferase
MDSIQIRSKTAADDEWVAEFLNRQLNGTYLPEPFGERGISTLPGLVAEIDGEPVGLLTYQYQNNECCIVSLHVIRKRMGIGESLLKRLESEASANACTKLICTVSNDNLNALRFLQKRDFHLVAVKSHAIDEQRKHNPTIKLTGEHGIPLRDELILIKDLTK